MATIKGEHHIWNGTSWDLYLMKTSADNIAETDNYKVMNKAERESIANHLTDFNAANKLIKLDAAAKFNSSLINFNSDINLEGNDITGVSLLQFLGEDYGFNVALGKLQGISSGGFVFKSSDPTDTLVEIIGDLNVGDVFASNIHTGGLTINNISAGDGGDYVRINGIDEVILEADVVNFSNSRGINIASPINDSDVANKHYVDQMKLQGTRPVTMVRAANIKTATAFGFGPADAVDGIVPATGDRVLIWNQEDPTKNGIYVKNAVSPFFIKVNPERENEVGALVSVKEGATMKHHQFYCNSGSVTSNTWIEFYVFDEYVGESGFITVNGSIISINNSSINAAKLANNAVTTVKITDGNVTDAKLASDAVTTVKILDKNVTTAKIADGAVTLGKIANFAATENMAYGETSFATTSKSLSEHISSLYSVIKNLRGTLAYNSNDPQTIASAYEKIETKNSILLGEDAPPAVNTGRKTGDFYIRRIS